MTNRRLLVPLAVALLGAGFLFPGPAGAQVDMLPNLVALPAENIHVGATDYPDEEGPRALRFATSTANHGDHPLELYGSVQTPYSAAAQQCVNFVDRGLCLERRDVGGFVFHPAHGHWHFEDYALYELRTLKRNGKPNMKPSGLAAPGRKVSFCLIDVEENAGGSGSSSPPGPFYTGCLGVFQGISPGWADVYHSELEGQQIPLLGVRDGRYALVITIDPFGQLAETTRADNRSFVKIRITGGGRGVTS